MGFIIAIIGGLILLGVVLMLISFWIFMLTLFAAFILGGLAAVAITSGSGDIQGAFLFGGLISVAIVVGIVYYIGAKDNPASKS